MGAVLTGGASRRMGRDKARIEVGGATMAERVAGALRAAGADAVVCVGPAVGTLDAIREDEPGSGPLGAIVAALRWAGGAPVLVAACDLVAPDAGAFATIAASLAAGADAAIPVVGGRAQPLAAIYAPSALDPLVAAFAGGQRSITAALDGLSVAELDGVPATALRDADEPGDLPR